MNANTSYNIIIPPAFYSYIMVNLVFFEPQACLNVDIYPQWLLNSKEDI